MKKVTIVLSILMGYCTTYSFAQIKKSPSLKVGDQLPEITFDHVIGYQKSTVKTSDFKGKILILDYWATWCHYCIECFPKNDSLQTKFGNNIEIMLVNTKDTRDDEQKVKEFYKKRMKADKNFKLPSIYLDTVLVDLFPHGLIPHYVWINKKGVVIAITDSGQVNAANIEKAIKDDELHLPVKTM